MSNLVKQILLSKEYWFKFDGELYECRLLEFDGEFFVEYWVPEEGWETDATFDCLKEAVDYLEEWNVYEPITRKENETDKEKRIC